MPLSREERAELEAFKSDVVAEVTSMTDGVKAHVEHVVAPFAPLAKKVEAIEAATQKQTPIIEKTASDVQEMKGERAEIKTTLKKLLDDAKRARASRKASRKERIKRSALEDEKRKRDLETSKWIKRCVAIAAALVSLGEAYRLFFTHDPVEKSQSHQSAKE